MRKKLKSQFSSPLYSISRTTRKVVFFIEKKIVQFKINVKAHTLIKKIAEKNGVPMSYVMRNFIYSGMHRYLKNDGGLINEISKKTE